MIGETICQCRILERLGSAGVLAGGGDEDLAATEKTARGAVTT